jgi:hypothetical protein
VVTQRLVDVVHTDIKLSRRRPSVFIPHTTRSHTVNTSVASSVARPLQQEPLTEKSDHLADQVDCSFSSTSSASTNPVSPVRRTRIMPSVLSKFNSAIMATVEQDSNSKPPYMRPGDPTPQTCVDWERACKRYANTKDIPADKVVKRTLDGIEDVRFIEWIELDRDRFEAMTLT